jgi:hypothetical protein
VQIVWVAAGILITLFLAILAVVYLLLVLGLWCPKDDHYE